MKKAERKMLEQEKVGEGEISINYKEKYSDEFYEEYVSSFEPGKKKKTLYRFVKRSLDIIVSFIALILLILPFAIIAIAIKCDSKGPVFFKNVRVGRYGKKFTCLKFRSMSVDAPSDVATSLGTTEGYITKVGRFLRKTSLDELPQLINVLRGEMSIIGYRPLVPTEVNCNAMRDRMGVFRMRPGISGYSQIKGRDDVYYRNKAIMDAYYVKNASLWFDTKLLFGSIAVVFHGKSNWDKTSEQKYLGEDYKKDQ